MVAERPKLTFENDRKLPEHVLTHNGQEVYKGTADNCYMQLQRRQPHSADYATKYEGWDVRPTGRQIDDPRITVTVTKDASIISNTVEFEYRGKKYRVPRNAVYGIPGYRAGQTIEIDSTYAYAPENAND